mmetsp:Transcript_62578/g.159103  ORF Transcript_62578/g.159103 Transcript_62578/m.159103 type:complete len:335 (-) Transcript_62578:55-1059(-)
MQFLVGQARARGMRARAIARNVVSAADDGDVELAGAVVQAHLGGGQRVREGGLGHLLHGVAGQVVAACPGALPLGPLTVREHSALSVAQPSEEFLLHVADVAVMPGLQGLEVRRVHGRRPRRGWRNRRRQGHGRRRHDDLCPRRRRRDGRRRRRCGGCRGGVRLRRVAGRGDLRPRRRRRGGRRRRRRGGRHRGVRLRRIAGRGDLGGLDGLVRLALGLGDLGLVNCRRDGGILAIGGGARLQRRLGQGRGLRLPLQPLLLSLLQRLRLAARLRCGGNGCLRRCNGCRGCSQGGSQDGVAARRRTLPQGLHVHAHLLGQTLLVLLLGLRHEVIG